MSQYVFILGAGASKDCGAPLMWDFLERAAEVYRTFNGAYSPPFSKVANAISALQAVHSKANLDIHGLEPVFGAMEMGRMLGRLPGAREESIEETLVAFREVISGTLEKLIAVPCDRTNTVHPPAPYVNFAKVIAAINENAGAPVCSVITLNYDVLTDLALYSHNSLGYNYGFENGGNGYVPLLKLHGSLNWGRCLNPECRKIIPWHIGQYLRDTMILLPNDNGTVELRLASRLRSAQLRHCDRAIDPTPVIVPPTWNKTDYAPTLVGVWQQAADNLSDAENIFVCGYSLPETDSFFKYLYALGAVGRALIRRFWVFDPDPNVEGRFRDLLGPASSSKFKRWPDTFVDMPNRLVSNLSIGMTRAWKAASA